MAPARRGCCCVLLALAHAVAAGSWSVEPSPTSSSSSSGPRRNTIIIFADDFGFDVGCYGAPTVRTPNIDKLASEGAKLTQYYSGENVCTPSRGAILTGRHAARSGLIIDVPWKTCGQGLSGSAKAADACADVFHPDSSGHLPTGEITLAEALKRAGGHNYATAALSKWHLGYSLINGTQRYLPTERGFDFFHGTPATHCESGGAWPPEPVFMTDLGTRKTNMVGRLDVGWSHRMGASNLTQSYAAYGRAFITTAVKAKQPFLLYAAFDNTHGGLYYAHEWAGSRRGQIGSATEELDWAVGQLLDAVTSAGIESDTTVWFMGDHGARTVGGDTTQNASPHIYGADWAKNLQYQQSHPGDSTPTSSEAYLDTGKAGTWEGGHRTSGIVWAPGLVRPGIPIMEVITSLDIFPTTLSLAGIPLPTDRLYDGNDVTPLLRGDAGAKPAKAWFFYFTTCTERNGCPAKNITDGCPSDRIAAVRDAHGPMKAHFFTHSAQGLEPFVRHDPPIVFNVERDPAEKEPVTDGAAFDGPDCQGKGCLATFRQAATAAVTEFEKTLRWCEHCKADGVAGRSMLSATAGNPHVMDCRGLTTAESGCCTGHGACRGKERRQTQKERALSG